MINNSPLRRVTDYGDLPRALAWFIITVREVGMPVVVIGALLYIAFITQEKMTTALSNVAVEMTKLDKNDNQIINNQRIIMDKIQDE